MAADKTFLHNLYAPMHILPLLSSVRFSAIKLYSMILLAEIGGWLLLSYCVEKRFLFFGVTQLQIYSTKTQHVISVDYQKCRNDLSSLAFISFP